MAMNIDITRHGHVAQELKSLIPFQSTFTPGYVEMPLFQYSSR